MITGAQFCIWCIFCVKFGARFQDVDESRVCNLSAQRTMVKLVTSVSFQLQ